MLWHYPERPSGQIARDAELGSRAFSVYVLQTGYGHYVGHTGNSRARLAAHRNGKVFQIRVATLNCYGHRGYYLTERMPLDLKTQ